MAKFRIAIAEGALACVDGHAARVAEHAELIHGAVRSPEQVAELTRSADALIVSLQPLRRDHLCALSASIRVICRAGVGLDTIDLTAAAARTTPVIYQPSYATAEVADHAVAMLLAATRRLVIADAQIRSGAWPGGPDVGLIPPLQEATAGIVGFGQIGQAVARRLAPFVSRIVVWDQTVAITDCQVSYAASLDELLAGCDLISLHLPLTDSTRNLIGAARLTSMRDNAVLVNTSRGGIVDESALADALRNGAISAAALDVFADEPLPLDSPLRRAPNLLLSPHIGWYSSASADRLARWSIDDAVSFLRSGAVQHGRLAVQ